MAFWSDLGKKISDTTQSVVEKTKTSTDTMRLNGLISDEERNVQRIYAEIGKKYMELHGADGDPDFAGLMQEYQTSKAKMEEYRSQIRKNKHLLICAGCGAEIPETVLYCTRCGAENPVGKRLAEEQRQREEAERAAREADLQAAAVPPTEPQPEFCARCGQPRTAGAMFCTFCGAQFVPPVAAAPVEPPAAPVAPAAPAPTPEAPESPAPESPAPEAAPAPAEPEASATESPAPEAVPAPAEPEASAPESPVPEAAPAPAAPEASAPESPAPEAAPAPAEPDAPAPELALPPAEEKPAAPAASSEVCPKCGAARIAGNRFCVQCGARYPETAHICPKCGKEIPGEFRFCIHCGTELPKE